MAGGVPANGIARWNGSSWMAIGDGFDDGVSAAAVYNGDLLVSKFFNIWKWTGSNWILFNSGFGGHIFTMTALSISMTC
jgi:hypothetical protein